MYLTDSFDSIEQNRDADEEAESGGAFTLDRIKMEGYTYERWGDLQIEFSGKLPNGAWAAVTLRYPDDVIQDAMMDIVESLVFEY